MLNYHLDNLLTSFVNFSIDYLYFLIFHTTVLFYTIFLFFFKLCLFQANSVSSPDTNLQYFSTEYSVFCLVILYIKRLIEMFNRSSIITYAWFIKKIFLVWVRVVYATDSVAFIIQHSHSHYVLIDQLCSEMGARQTLSALWTSRLWIWMFRTTTKKQEHYFNSITQIWIQIIFWDF